MQSLRWPRDTSSVGKPSAAEESRRSWNIFHIHKKKWLIGPPLVSLSRTFTAYTKQPSDQDACGRESRQTRNTRVRALPTSQAATPPVPPAQQRPLLPLRCVRTHARIPPGHRVLARARARTHPHTRAHARTHTHTYTHNHTHTHTVVHGVCCEDRSSLLM